MTDTPWLLWAREIQALAQTGLSYTRDMFDKQRYERLREIAADIVTHHEAVTRSDVITAFEAQSGYATPKVDVRGACFRNGEVLLVQERSDGLWTLPGGWADVNESAAECVVREVREESGFEVRVCKLAAVFDRDKHPHTSRHLFHIYKMFFICEVMGGAPALSEETMAVDFFPMDGLPPLSLGRVLAQQIMRMHEHWLRPSLPTDYD